jgi:hypothetical protein
MHWPSNLLAIFVPLKMPENCWSCIFFVHLYSRCGPWILHLGADIRGRTANPRLAEWAFANEYLTHFSHFTFFRRVLFLFILPKWRYSSSKSIAHWRPRDNDLSISMNSQKVAFDPPCIVGQDWTISKMTIFMSQLLDVRLYQYVVRDVRKRNPNNRSLRVHSQNYSVRFCHEGRQVETRRDHKIGRGNRREEEIILINNRYWWQIVGGNSESGKPSEKCEPRLSMKTESIKWWISR